MQAYAIIIIFIFTLVLFFWSIYKAIKTKENKYAWGMLPFFLFMIGIFLL